MTDTGTSPHFADPGSEGRRGIRAAGPPPALVYLMLLQFATGGALYPFIALYLEDRGLERSQVSIVFVAASAASSILPFLWGWVADRLLAVNRLIALLHLGAATILLAITRLESYPAIVVAFGFYCGLQQPTNALANTLCYHNLRDPPREFGRLRLWGSLGWTVPSVPVLLWLACRETRDLDVAIYLAVGLELLLVCTSPLLPHTPPPARAGRWRSSFFRPFSWARTYREDVRRLLARPGFVFLLLSILFTMASFAIMFYYSGPRLEDAGIPRSWIGLILAIGPLVEVPLFLSLRLVIERLGYRRTLLMGASAALVRHAVYAFSGDPVVLVASTALLAPCVVYFLITASLAVNSLAQPEVRATAQSLQLLAGAGVGSMSGLLMTGWLTSGGARSLQLPFLFAAVAALVGMVFLLPLRAGGSVRTDTSSG